MTSLRSTLIALCAILFHIASEASPVADADSIPEVAVFITIGQSNADGSAFFDPAEDRRLRAWYESPANTGGLRIWYRSTKVVNAPANARGEQPRLCVDGDTADMPSGWLDLWYRNENALGRTAMNMIHSFGTYSTGTGTDCAQGRRGMEGEFGMLFRKAFPHTPLCILKLGVSGSSISTWTDSVDDHNWRYFCQNIYTPAIRSLIRDGYRPRLAGIWWMQGCADSGAATEYYAAALTELIRRCRTELHFPSAPFYIGLIPETSRGYSPAVRAAQEQVAARITGVHLIDTSSCPMQYESAFRGTIHFSHRGVNMIARLLADRVCRRSLWAPYVQ